jgi:hypothetical protein
MPEREDRLDQIKARLAGTYRPPPKAPFDIHKAALFAGIAGLELPAETYELAPGLILNRTYAHVILSATMAFARPKNPRTHHPGPWASLAGGGIDITAELSLAPDAPPFGFRRPDVLWFVTALLRLRSGGPILALVLADRAFHTVPSDTEAANLIPIELQPEQLKLAPQKPLTIADLDWIQDNLLGASRLMRDSTFNRVVQTLDSVVRVTNPGSAILIAWAAIEALLRPGRNQITERVCKALAAYLYQPGSERDRAYPKIVASYEARGGAVHAGDAPEAEQLQYAFSLARAAVSRAIEQKALPEVDALLVQWKQRA